MAKVKATENFTVTVMHRGGNVLVRGVKGEAIDLDQELVDLVNRDGDKLVPDTKPKAPKPKTTRQVKKAPNRKG